MRREIAECPHRRILAPGTGTDGVVDCSAVRRILGTLPDHLSRVDASVCLACCDHHLPSPGHLNPVVASVVYQAAVRLREDGDAPWRDREEAARCEMWVGDHLEVLPREAGPPTPSRSDEARSGLVWAVGLVTAPRPQPTIERTLRGLRDAGFGDVHIFAEPGSWIPPEFAHLPRTIRGRALGNVPNFFASLVALFLGRPNADAYGVFEDDFETARGLRAWCDGQFWPHGAGLVSLYTCRAHQGEEPGWHVRSLGLYRTFGGLAFVFRKDVLKAFLSDGRVLEMREAGLVHGIDQVVGEWAERHGVGIAYHTPSLVAHIGGSSTQAGLYREESSLLRQQAVSSVGDLAGWRPPATQIGAVGVVGWNTPSGLGYANRALATHLPAARWMVPPHPLFPTLPPPPLSATKVDYVPLSLDHDAQRAWMKGLDWILFVEFCYLSRLAHCARDVNVQVACVPMWELTHLQKDWVYVTDLMLCPTRFTYDLMTDWRRRFGFAWDVVHIPWPVDVRHFRYRRRRRCERFVFINGNGGCDGVRIDGTPAGYRRKGMEVLLEAARLVPNIPFIVYTQFPPRTPVPPNVELRRPPTDNARLYDDGDVCVQPSHWEGLGLQLLECQAAGMPLITTDAPPMNEYRPMRTIPSRQKELLLGMSGHVITGHKIVPEDIAALLDSVYRTDIAEASERARAFVERHHCWEVARPLFRQALSR